MKLNDKAAQKLLRTIPGFDKVMEKVHDEAASRNERRKEQRTAKKKAEIEKELYEKVVGNE